MHSMLDSLRNRIFLLIPYPTRDLAVLLLLHDITVGADRIETPFSDMLPLVTLRGVMYSIFASMSIMPLPSNGRLF
jgi:hypothetical protein